MANLAVHLLSDILYEAEANGMTMALRTASEGGFRLSFFEDGRLVYLVSELPSEAFGRFLESSGKLETPAERAALLEAEQLVSRSRPLLGVLLESGEWDEDRLQEWYLDYVYSCFTNAFATRNLTAKMMPGVKAPHPIRLGVRCLDLILESVRRQTSMDVIREALGHTSYRIEPAPDHMERLVSLPLNYFEGAVGSRLTQSMTIADAVSSSGLGEEDALRALVALRATRVVDPFVQDHELTDSGRLRLREAAKASGYEVSKASIVSALGLSKEDGAVDEPGGTPFTPGEWEDPSSVPPQAQVARHDPPVQEAPPRRGNTGQLRVLSSAYIEMAESEAAAGNFAGAVQCYESALSQNPRDLPTKISFAKLLLTRDTTLSAAERLLLRTCVEHPDAPEPRIELVRLYRRMGDPRKTASAITEARRLAPNHPDLGTSNERSGSGIRDFLRGKR